MPKIAVITDTDSSLPPQMAESLGIHQVPITINFGEKSYTTGVDIDDRLVFEIIDRNQKLPTTAAPSPAAFAAAYRQAFEAGADEIVCICVSSQVSATYNAAVSACEEFPGRRIEVVDSLTITMGQGFMTLAAASAAAAGDSMEEVLEKVRRVGENLHVFALLPTLKYLAMSGRVGKFVAGMADVLNIRPILTIKDGKLALLERVRTHAKAMDRILELIVDSVGDKKVERLSVIHVNNPEGAAELERKLCQRIACPGETLTVAFTPGLAVHAGSGLVGVVIQTA